MPTPEQSRLTTPQTRVTSNSDNETNLRGIERWANGLPFFPLHQGQYYPSTTISKTGGVFTDINLGTVGLFSVRKFTKIENWTNVVVQMNTTSKCSAVTDAYWSVRFVSLSTDLEVAAAGVGMVNHDSANVRFRGGGMNIISGVPAGKYEVRGTWALNGGGTVQLDTSCLMQIFAQESIPVPA